MSRTTPLLRQPGLTAAVPTPPLEPLRPGAADRATRNRSGLHNLLSERPELRGVHAPADLAAEAIRWSA